MRCSTDNVVQLIGMVNKQHAQETHVAAALAEQERRQEEQEVAHHWQGEDASAHERSRRESLVQARHDAKAEHKARDLEASAAELQEEGRMIQKYEAQAEILISQQEQQRHECVHARLDRLEQAAAELEHGVALEALREKHITTALHVEEERRRDEAYAALEPELLARVRCKEDARWAENGRTLNRDADRLRLENLRLRAATERSEEAALADATHALVLRVRVWAVCVRECACVCAR